jgi:hypothetical protein
MTTNFEEDSRATSDPTRRSLGVVATGSFAQAAAAGGAAVMAIIGLAGTLTDYMMTIGTIALGAAFLMQGGSVASQQFRFSSRAGELAGPSYGGSSYGVGVTAAAIAGIAGLALGILALLGVSPTVLVPSAIVTFAGALILDTGAVDLRAMPYQSVDRISGGSTMSSGGGTQLVGIGGAAIGILALIGVAPITLSLVALLALGATTFLMASAIGTKIVQASR